nr:MAG TPA: hypothetical protein [Caudoviricetes sp.]DAO85906.1 MAG TPA: hypothetical protein [Caudoviricetes sp.]
MKRERFLFHNNQICSPICSTCSTIFLNVNIFK